MANSLGRNVEPGELVVLDKKGLKPEYQALEQRILVAKGGFGLHADTMGRAFYAQDLFDRTEFRWDGYAFNPEETDTLKEQLMALELWIAERAVVFLNLTGNTAWAWDVVHATEIWHEQEMDLLTDIDQPPNLSNR